MSDDVFSKALPISEYPFLMTIFMQSRPSRPNAGQPAAVGPHLPPAHCCASWSATLLKIIDLKLVCPFRSKYVKHEVIETSFSSSEVLKCYYD